MEAKLRRYQTLIKTLGLGVLVFGLWNILKTIIYNIITSTSDINDSGSIELEMNQTNQTALLVVFIILLFFLLMDIVLRLVVFFSTRSISAGKSKGIICVITSSILAIIYGISVPYDVINLGYSSKTFIDSIATIILDTTAVIFSVGVIYATIKIMTIKKAINAQKGA